MQDWPPWGINTGVIVIWKVSLVGKKNILFFWQFSWEKHTMWAINEGNKIFIIITIAWISISKYTLCCSVHLLHYVKLALYSGRFCLISVYTINVLYAQVHPVSWGNNWGIASGIALIYYFMRVVFLYLHTFVSLICVHANCKEINVYTSHNDSITILLGNSVQ